MDFAVKENELGSPYTVFSETARHRHFSLSSTFGAHQHQQQQTQRETHLCACLHRGTRDGRMRLTHISWLQSPGKSMTLMTDACTNGFVFL